MKVCNYCGTGMDNQVVKCPFCGQDTTLKGAIKYEDSRPFDGSLDVVRSRDGKTNAEKRFEEMNRDSFSSNLLEKINNMLDESKKKSEESRYSSHLNVDKNHVEKSPIVEDDIKAAKAKPKVKVAKPVVTINTNKKASTAKPVTPKVSALIFLGIFIFFMALGVIMEFDDYLNDDSDFIGTEYFEFGEYDEDRQVYTNDYMGITYEVQKEFDKTFFYDDCRLGYVDEFETSNDDYTASLSIKYINKDYYGYYNANTMYDYEKEYEKDTAEEYKFVKDVETEIQGNAYIGFIYKDKWESSFGDSGVRYHLYLVSDYNEYYFTVIELETCDSPDDFEVMLKGFN